MARLIARRGALRLLAAAPFGIALHGCSGSPSGMDGGLDGGADPSDAGPSDAALVDGGGCQPSQADALGPFFEDGSPARMMLAEAGEPGERLLVEGTLRSAARCDRGLEGYVLDVWQADAEGNYHSGPGHRLRGRVVTGADGGFRFETIVPGRYATGGGLRPAHLHVRVYDPAGADRLITQLYFEGDPYLGEADSCGPPTCFSDDAARVMPTEPARVGGVDGLLARARLIV